MAKTKTWKLEEIRVMLDWVYRETRQMTEAPMNDPHKLRIYKKFYDEVAEIVLGD